MNTSQQIEKVSAALAGAFADLHNVAADAVNPHFRSRYTSLPALLDAVRPVLAKHGLAVVQMPISEEGRVGVETLLLHASGQYLSSRVTVTPQKADPQGAGSAITYCRRYALAACLGIGQDDDDGNAASRAPAAKAAPPPARKAEPAPASERPQNGTISEAQGKRLWAIAASRAQALEAVSRDEIVRDVLGRRGIEHTKEIPREAYDRIIAEVEKWEPPVATAPEEAPF